MESGRRLQAGACVIGCLVGSLLLPGCGERATSDRTTVASAEVTERDLLTPVLFMRTRPSNQVGAHEPPFDAVLFESGLAMRYPRGAEDDQPQMARITPTDLQEFLKDVDALELARFSEQARLPPGSGYAELGIRSGEKLKRYAWSGKDWDLAASERAAFVGAWAEAESLIRRFDDRVWSPAPPELASEVAASLR